LRAKQFVLRPIIIEITGSLNESGSEGVQEWSWAHFCQITIVTQLPVVSITLKILKSGKELLLYLLVSGKGAQGTVAIRSYHSVDKAKSWL
jgi:hypothetical protein